MKRRIEKLKWAGPSASSMCITSAPRPPRKVRRRHKNNRRLEIKTHGQLGVVVVQDNLLRDGKVPAFVVSEQRIVSFKDSMLRAGFVRQVLSEGEVLKAMDGYMDTVHREFLANVPRKYAPLQRIGPCQVKRCSRCDEWLGGHEGFRCTACDCLVSTCGACGCGVRRGPKPAAVLVEEVAAAPSAS